MKDPIWHQQATPSAIRQRLEWFSTIMSGAKDLPISTIETAIRNNNTYPSKDYNLNLDLYSDRAHWAWKEPNSHIYLKHYVQVLPNLKYILVIRDGCDMALSKNVQQLTIWGNYLYGLDYDINDIESVYQAQLDYWINANNKAIKAGQLYLGPNFLVSNFDKLCTQPKFEIQRIIKFLGISTENTDLEAIEQLPIQPASTGRYSRSGHKFSHDALRKVHLLNLGQPF